MVCAVMAGDQNGARADRTASVVDFYNQINLLYGSITEFCSPQSCPEMKATDEYVQFKESILLRSKDSRLMDIDLNTFGRTLKTSSGRRRCLLQSTSNT